MFFKFRNPEISKPENTIQHTNNYSILRACTEYGMPRFRNLKTWISKFEKHGKYDKAIKTLEHTKYFEFSKKQKNV